MNNVSTPITARHPLQLTAAALLLVALLGGCSNLKLEPWVKPYERQNLSDPIMKQSRHPIADMHVGHVLEGREAARGAEGGSGGGCGCN
ncbi:DUF4266 domain-containing protein [Ferrimonas senticii]|uniref:DUF4266 domain-containing protein n=1 Tax=Ferrimonas senticii TaxID=394566 RepID=UPI0003FD9BB1|nr:DUF4266 domain-containing protein [Ferrimonas senticii]